MTRPRGGAAADRPPPGMHLPAPGQTFDRRKSTRLTRLTAPPTRTRAARHPGLRTPRPRRALPPAAPHPLCTQRAGTTRLPQSLPRGPQLGRPRLHAKPSRGPRSLAPGPQPLGSPLPRALHPCARLPSALTPLPSLPFRPAPPVMDYVAHGPAARAPRGGRPTAPRPRRRGGCAPRAVPACACVRAQTPTVPWPPARSLPIRGPPPAMLQRGPAGPGSRQAAAPPPHRP
jgi:hypothetical protein